MRFYYYVDKEGVRQGPLPIEKLTPNEITPDTLVFCKGMKNWQRAKSVDDFYKILNLGDNGTQDAKTTVTESDDSHDGDVLLSSIASRYGVIIDAETSSYIRENVASKLANIKFIKERFNIGLKEAKEIVDDIYASNGLNQQTIEYAETAPVNEEEVDEDENDENGNEDGEEEDDEGKEDEEEEEDESENEDEQDEDEDDEDEDDEKEFYSTLKYWIIGGIIALVIVFAFMPKRNKAETSIDSVDQLTVDSIASIAPEEEERIIKEFITNMYNNHLYDEYRFLEKHCSRHLLEKLSEDYGYDHDGVAYAVWNFQTGAPEAKPGGNNKKEIISVVASGDGWYTYEFYDNGWRGRTRLKCFIQDGEVIMDVLEKIYDEWNETSANTIDKYWTLNGYMISNGTKYPILLTFHQSGEELYDCKYNNVTYGGKIQMNGSITDDGLIFRGKDGDKDFIIEVSTDYSNGGWSGYSRVGDEILETHLEES